MGLILAVMVIMAVLLISEEAGSAGGVVIGFAVVFVLYLLCRRQIVNRAGETLETASDGLWQNYSIFAILGPLEAVYVMKFAPHKKHFKHLKFRQILGIHFLLDVWMGCDLQNW